MFSAGLDFSAKFQNKTECAKFYQVLECDDSCFQQGSIFQQSSKIKLNAKFYQVVFVSCSVPVLKVFGY